LGSWLVWWLVTEGNENPGQVRVVAAFLALLVFWFVPGFRIVELLPFFDNLRAPFDFWQVVAPIFCSALAAVVLVQLFRELISPVLRVAIGVLLVFLAGWDVMGHAARQRDQVLPEGVWKDWLAVQDSLEEDAVQAGLIWPSSGRYFFTTAPFLSGRGLVTEAFQNYLQLRGYAMLVAAGQWREEHRENALRLSGAGWVWLDEDDGRENPAVAGLENVIRRGSQSLWKVRDPLAPGFFAERVVLVGRNPGVAEFPAMLEAMRYGLVPIERPERNQLDPEVGGLVADGNLILQEEEELVKELPWAEIEVVERAPDGTRWVVRAPAEAAEGAEAGARGWVVLTQPWHKDWRVESGGRLVEPERAFGALLAAEVPRGAVVEFCFSPPWWYDASAWVGLFGWLAVGPFFWFTRERRGGHS
jgi:hypothetical protein